MSRECDSSPLSYTHPAVLNAPTFQTWTRISEDAGFTIESDLICENDREYIVHLVGQIVRVRVETEQFVSGRPADYADSKPLAPSI